MSLFLLMEMEMKPERGWDIDLLGAILKKLDYQEYEF